MTDPLRLSDFQFELPEELIAQSPLANRSESRLMVMDRGSLAHRQFSDLPALLQPGDRLVFNDTAVVKARLHGAKSTGGKVEVFVERILANQTLLAKLRASKTPKAGAEILIGKSILRVIERSDDMFLLQCDSDIEELMDQYGEIPLPPYIQRKPSEQDAQRYQTVYAANPGAVAAPTAGLHFDTELLDALSARGIDRSFVTLHVGAGTFQPVRVDDVQEHVMHAERVEVSEQCVAEIEQTRANGGRIIAVGTTAVRSLESAASDGQLKSFENETRLFLTPGSRFNVVDGMITNFHLSESTLLMLVCAFAGQGDTLEAYKQAVDMRYRFFSYGDAMLVWPAEEMR